MINRLNRTKSILIVSFALSFTGLFSQEQSPKIKSAETGKFLEHFKNAVVKKDSSLKNLINDDEPLEKVASGFGFTEGVTWIDTPGESYLLFSDMAANVIYKRDKNGVVTTYMKNTGYPFQDIWRVGMRFNNSKPKEDPAYEEFNLIGSDGMTLDKQGRLLIATWTGRSIERIEKDGKKTILADRYQGKRLGGPNDLVVDKKGGIYFSDTFGSMINPDNNPENELKEQGIYYLKENGEVIRVIDDIPSTNGVAISPDGKDLYANGSSDRFIRRYEIQSDGTVKNGKLLIDLSKEKGLGITDGMKVDSKGYIWTTGPGGIWILSPEGKVLGSIAVPEPCTNLVFGDDDKSTLYISTPGSIFRIKTKARGLQ